MSKNNRVLIIDKMHDSLVPMLQKIGFEAKYEPFINREQILQGISDNVGLVVRSKTSVDKDLIDAGTQLRFVARAGAGMDGLDTEYLGQKGIDILNAPEGNRDAVGEHTIGLLLNLLNRISTANNQVKKGIWQREENRGFELKNKTIGIYGFGNTGESFARKLAGFDSKVLAFDKYRKGFSSPIAKGVTLDEFRENTEILSLHIPLTEETKQLFNASELLKYPNLKILINTARGGILDLSNAVELVENGNLLGLGLDVLENEKIDKLSQGQQGIFERLTALDNVIVTPHVAGWTHESYERINQVMVEKIEALKLLQ